MKRRHVICFFFLIAQQQILGQCSLDSQLRPSDSIDSKRQKLVFFTEASLSTGILIALHQAWYANYSQSSFHFKNDNSNWLQMDKIGHFYSSYHLGSAGAQALEWSGATKKKQLIYGASLGFAFLSVVELMDGFSRQWGASGGDIAANAAGMGWYVAQELLWKEQRILPKFSYNKTVYSNIRPEVLGSSPVEKILKDYNGQTYWLSANLYSFCKHHKIPKWINLAFGYGADGMLSANHELFTTNSLVLTSKVRQFYFSLDLDLTKIDTKSHVLKTLFSVFNTVKIPSPTLQYTVDKGLKFYPIYF